MRQPQPFLVCLLSLLLTACAVNSQSDSPDRMGSGMRMDPGMMQRHMASIPPEYADLTNPIPAEAESLARGKEIYEANCVACHGAGGWGDGPAAASLTPPPAQVAHTAQMLSDAYLFYRISAGGGFAPFSSAMPAWKEKLNEAERWDVINYVRSLGGNGMMGNASDGMMNGSGMMEGDGMMGGIMMGGGMMMTFMLGWMILGWALVLAVLAAIVVGIVWVVRRASGDSRSLGSPLDILKRRYARGEVSAEQFEAMKRQLAES